MKLTLIVVAIALVAFVGWVQSRPGRLHVERAARMEAPGDAVFPHLVDFRRWPAWSPYDRRDPAMQRSYEGPPSGVGAVYRWNGNADVGEGSARIVDVAPGRRVVIALDFVRPMKASNTATFTLVPDDRGTRVTWAIDGTPGFLAKLMGTFMDMDRMIGGDFEQGLASLKGLVERAPVEGGV